jgi:glycosyltransferase involved in cell wall biosynthesis
MKIAFIGQKGIPATSGGVERHVDELSTRLARAGHDVYVYTRPHYTNRYLKHYQQVNLISLPSIATKHFDAITHTFFACFDAIFFRDYDIIHFHSIGPSSLIWTIKLFKPGTPVLATFHAKCYEHRKWGSMAKDLLKMGEFVLNRTADKVITVSKSLKKYADDWYGIESVYIPNGVNIPKLLPADIISKKWGLSKNSYYLIVSRLVGHKGIHNAIKAYKTMATGKKLVIVGEGAHTNTYVEYLHALADFDPNIIFTGEQSGETLAELFSNAYLFIQPSESEGLSIALLEAMSYNRPVLVSDIPENREVVGKEGFLFKNKDHNDLKKKLTLYESSHNVRSGHKNKNKGIVRENYDWDDITSSTLEAYRQAIFEKTIRKSTISGLAKAIK